MRTLAGVLSLVAAVVNGEAVASSPSPQALRGIAAKARQSKVDAKAAAQARWSVVQGALKEAAGNRELRSALRETGGSIVLASRFRYVGKADKETTGGWGSYTERTYRGYIQQRLVLDGHGLKLEQRRSSNGRNVPATARRVARFGVLGLPLRSQRVAAGDWSKVKPEAIRKAVADWVADSAHPKAPGFKTIKPAETDIWFAP